MVIIEGIYYLGRSFSLFKDIIDLVSQFDIVIANAINVMSHQVDRNGVIHIKPLWMMVHLFSMKSYLCHESKCLDEIPELE